MIPKAFPEERVFLGENHWVILISKKVDMLKYEEPLINISASMMICPNGVQNVDVSCTINPVRVTADVAVNRASVIAVSEVPWRDAGRVNIIVPIITRIRKNDNIIAGEKVK